MVGGAASDQPCSRQRSRRGKLSNWLRGRPAQPVGGWGCAGLTAPQDLLQRDQAACFVVPAMSATPDQDPCSARVRALTPKHSPLV